jgi:hypothetical protein
MGGRGRLQENLPDLSRPLLQVASALRGFRNHMHWSELAGGDVVICPPYKWQKRFNASGIKVSNRIDEPVNPAIVDELRAKFPDFVSAWTEGGLSHDEFDTIRIRLLSADRAYIRPVHRSLSRT